MTFPRRGQRSANEQHKRISCGVSFTAWGLKGFGVKSPLGQRPGRFAMQTARKGTFEVGPVP